MAPLTSADIILTCSGTEGDAYLQCVMEQLLLQDEADREYSRTIYLIFSAALVFFMQAGEFIRSKCMGSVGVV
jgi:hypothetical protein